MNLLKFLAENWDSVLAVVAVVAVSVFGAGKRWRNVLKPVLFGLVTWAEREYGPGTGTLKLAVVIEKFYPHIPALLRGLFSANDIEKWINAALEDAKLKWEKNPKLLVTAAKPPPN